jgi:hypothetical protein
MHVIKVVESLLTEDELELKLKLKSTARNPFPSGYTPEVDVTTKYNNELSSRFLQLIGILRWAIELGQMDILWKFHSYHNIKHYQSRSSGSSLSYICILEET